MGATNILRLLTAALMEDPTAPVPSGGTPSILPDIDDTRFDVGDGTNSWDLRFFGSAATKYISWDASADDLKFEDSVSLMFGTGAAAGLGTAGDVEVRWDGTDLDWLASTDDYVIKFGDGTKSFDLWWYGDTASDYILWDASANRLDLVGAATFGLHRIGVVSAKTANYTCVAADSGTIFTNTGAAGAVTFTLPAASNTGWTAKFVVVANQNVTVARAGTDAMVLFNNASGASIAFSTVSEKIGGAVEVVSDGTRWLCFVNLGAETQTPTIA